MSLVAEEEVTSIKLQLADLRTVAEHLSMALLLAMKWSSDSSESEGGIRVARAVLLAGDSESELVLAGYQQGDPWTLVWAMEIGEREGKTHTCDSGRGGVPTEGRIRTPGRAKP